MVVEPRKEKSMRKVRALLVLGFMLLPVAPAFATENAQQQKMKTCNAEATQKSLSGADRQAFMKTCLAGGNSQQKKMKTCNTQASSQHLTGDARKKFMSDCLKGS
jgi:hypothetical protein